MTPAVTNLFLAAALFAIGAIGVLTKRNAISLFMCVELMLNAANLAVVSLAARPLAGGFGPAGAEAAHGAMIVLFVITVAAAEAGVGLAIFIKIFFKESHIDVDKMEALRG